MFSCLHAMASLSYRRAVGYHYKFLKLNAVKQIVIKFDPFHDHNKSVRWVNLVISRPTKLANKTSDNQVVSKYGLWSRTTSSSSSISIIVS